jgi:hypothetical protein
MSELHPYHSIDWSADRRATAAFVLNGHTAVMIGGMRELQGRGLSMRAIAAELEKRKVSTPQGGAWHPETVTRIVRRIEAA